MLINSNLDIRSKLRRRTTPHRTIACDRELFSITNTNLFASTAEWCSLHDQLKSAETGLTLTVESLQRKWK